MHALPADRWNGRRLRPLIAIPGFIQTHIHLCQTLFRGLAEDVELLDWLRLRIFPFEAAHSPASMYASARIGLAELIRSGTTTIMDMGSVHHEEEVVRAVEESGIRAFLGKALMDINEFYPPLREGTEDAVTSALRAGRAVARAARAGASGTPSLRGSSCRALSELLREAHAMTSASRGCSFIRTPRRTGTNWKRCGRAAGWTTSSISATRAAAAADLSRALYLAERSRSGT